MGNRANRVKLAKRLKELGLGKLYSGNKKVAWRRLNVRQLLRFLQWKPGDVVNDCDGLNHVIVKPIWRRATFSHWYGKPIRGWWFDADQYEFTDGRWSCGCPASPDPPLSREEIETYMQAYVSDAKLREQGWTITVYHEALRQAFAAGEHVCDERGILLPKFAILRG
jgi:hypothetical protein